MPIIKHISIYAAPKRLLSYVANEKKTEECTFVTGINCSANPMEAYEDMKNTFEKFTGERFFKKSISDNSENTGKQKIRLHHYIQSFAPGEVTPEEAHRIGKEWAEKVFGKNHQILFATHVDRGHIHNHFAVAAYDMEGKHWNANRTTLNRCKSISDKIAEEHGLSIIEKPRYKANHKYGEYRARRNGSSWKKNLCDEIDSIIMKENVRGIDDLISELEAKGYKINRGKYLAIKVKPDRKAIRTYRLGDGYSLEHLEYRIKNKNMEMPLSEALKYSGIQRDYALCIRQIQIQIYRKPESDRLHFATYREVEKSSKLLYFLRDNDIHSAEDFQKYVSAAYRNFDNIKSEKNKLLEKIAEEEKIVKDIPNYLELKNKVPLLAKDIKELAKYNYLKNVGTDIEEHMEKIKMLKCELSEIDERLENAKSEKKQAEEYFNSYMLNMKTDYEILLEQARAEMEELRKNEEKQKIEIDEKQKLSFEQKKELQKNER